MIARLSVHAIEDVTIRGAGAKAVAQRYRIIGKAGRLPDRPLRIDPDDADACLDWLGPVHADTLSESCYPVPPEKRYPRSGILLLNARSRPDVMKGTC